MKIHQIFLAASALAMTLAAPASYAWTAAYSTSPTASASSSDLGGFTNTDITVNLSKNVTLGATGTTTALAVQAASTKGKALFGATTMGGSVKECNQTNDGKAAAVPAAATDGCS